MTHHINNSNVLCGVPTCLVGRSNHLQMNFLSETCDILLHLAMKHAFNGDVRCLHSAMGPNRLTMGVYRFQKVWNVGYCHGSAYKQSKAFSMDFLMFNGVFFWRIHMEGRRRKKTHHITSLTSSLSMKEETLTVEANGMLARNGRKNLKFGVHMMGLATWMLTCFGSF